MKRLSFCCLLMAFVCLHLPAEQPSPQPFRQADYRGASFSYVLLDAETGELCAKHRPEQVLSSASIVKLLTTATALEVLGPDYAAETRLYYQGKIQDGVLHGGNMSDERNSQKNSERYDDKFSVCIKSHDLNLLK